MRFQQSTPVNRRIGIAARIIVPVILLLVISNALVLYVTLASNKQQLLANTHSEIASSTALQQTFFQSAMNELSGDVLFLSGTPPIAGLIRASRNEGYDQDDQSSQVAWKSRLAKIFVGMLNSKPQTSQLRFIDANGMEQIRVDRSGENGEIRIVPNSELQNKATRDYFHAATKLSAGQVYFSDIELNREHGKIIEPHEPTIRGSTPVQDEFGNLFGVIVKNQYLESAFNDMLALAEQDRFLLIANREGEYVVHPTPGRSFRFEYSQRSNIVDDIPELYQFVSPEDSSLEATGDLPWEGETYTYHIRRVVFGPNPERDYIFVFSSEEASTILAPNIALRNKVLLFLIFILLVAATLSWAAARQIVHPISQMNWALRTRRLALSEADVPVSAPGELGSLARGFADFSAALQERRRAELKEMEERKAAEVALQHHNEKLSQANHELAQFAYIASHDLQEPLRTVRSFIDLFRQYYGASLDSQAMTFLGFMDDSSSRMSDLIKGLLDYSRLGVTADREELDLQLVVDQVCSDLKQRLDESGASIHYEQLPNVKGLAVELRLLFQNLISNAIKFSRKGVPPQIEITVQKMPDHWLFSVSDNGIGIEERSLDRIFLIFQRLHSRDAFEGTGIGLAHCKKIVEAHGGKIWVESEVDVGSTFYFTLKEVNSEKA